MKFLVLAVVAVWAAVWVVPDGKLHVIFCDVGQGDAILVTYTTTQILVDGGPDDRVLECLSRHLPFYDKRIEVVVLTHPQADHQTGLIEVAKRYTILRFVSDEVFAGDVVSVAGLRFQVVWPTVEFAALADKTNLNDFSLVGILSWGDFDVLLTGDADSRVQAQQLATGWVRQVEVLKVPHHGSKTAMTQDWLTATAPQLAVISVGRRNPYGHPGPETLEMLKQAGAQIRRTDLDGEIEVVSDGQRWWLE